MLKFKIISAFVILAVFAIVLINGYSKMSLLWIFMPIALWVIIISIGSFSMGYNFFINSFTYKKKITTKKIAITFDDGPHPKYTTSILDILERYNDKATFFCIGKNIEQHPELLKTILDKGHSVGNHSYSHSNLIDFSSEKTWLEEIFKTDKLIGNISGEKPIFFRPPYGVTTPNLAKALNNTKHQVIGWNIRSLDTVFKNKKLVLKRIIKKVKPGSIILLHDTQPNTGFILEHLLIHLKQKNFEAVTITELLNEN